MTIVKKQGIWLNASYPFSDQTSAGMMGSIVAEFDAWVSAISSNASLTANGMVPVKVREPSDSTNNGTNNGFGYEFPDTSIGLNKDGPTYPVLLVHGTQSSLRCEVGDEFVDSTTNSGFGDIGNTPGHVSAVTVSGDANYDNQANVFYDATDGEEFFAVGFKLGTGSGDNGGLVIFRDTDGHWCFGTGAVGFAYDTVIGYWTGTTGPYDTDPYLSQNATNLRPLIFSANAGTGANNKPGFDGVIQGRWFPSNSALYSGAATASKMGDYTLINGDTEAIVMLGYQSPAVKVPV